MSLPPPADREILSSSAYEALLEADEVAPRDERLVPPRADETLLELTDQTVYGEILLEDLVRRQLVLALSITAIFLALLFALPLGSLVLPQLFATPVFGLPLGWVLVAVAVYPLLWLLAAYYVSASKQNEDEFTELLSR